MYMLIMVVDDVEHLPEVLEAWVGAGVQGVTILESTGINRVLRRTQARAMFMGFSQLFGEAAVGHNTLFAVIDSLDIARAAVAATEAVIGDLRQPHTGIIFAVPVAMTWGLPEPSGGEISNAGVE
ncbi:MAG: hypothetical protein RRC07_15855 [Anaerolineae bacterium]|nr:hypothetical protein [Anaerolineae bacterium]